MAVRIGCVVTVIKSEEMNDIFYKANNHNNLQLFLSHLLVVKAALLKKAALEPILTGKHSKSLLCLQQRRFSRIDFSCFNSVGKISVYCIL